MSEGTPPSAPSGDLLVHTLAMPANANLVGGIFGGWILLQFDLAAGMLGTRRSRGPVVTVAVEKFAFLTPLRIGEEFSVHGQVAATGSSSMTLALEGWAASSEGGERRLIARGTFISVAIDAENRKRPLPAA
ncbi:hotdog domain-containing protein [Pseudoxanthobacter sp.]|uniref:acyl-CoA thioesterase n=1 Tax=Pseudoxanthobacter sp. TaxID=1925742 RepID=UPI002FE111EF